MAIIYTYPRLTNPQGNELIVVSDVNNKNATRLITLASIASLVPVGSGCATTYVLKPVICDSGNCTASEFSNSWLYTCKEEFAQFADTGTVVNIKNNNIPVEGNTNSDCWYVETWSPVPTATTCENCCTSAQVDVCIYVPCGKPSNGGDEEARALDDFARSVTTCGDNIPFPVIVETPLGTGCDPFIYVTHNPTGDTCCMQLQGSSVGAPGNATPDITVSPISDCNDPVCQEAPEFNRQYTKCATDCITSELPGTYIVNDNLNLGPMITVTYDDGNGTQQACYTRQGVVPEPPSVLPNITAAALAQETCAQAFEDGACAGVVDVWSICPSSEGTGAPLQIYTTVSAVNPGDVALVEINGVVACYTKEPETDCNKLTQGVTNFQILEESSCEDDACPNAETFYQIRLCGEENFQNVSTDLSEYAPLSGTYVWGNEGDCYEIRQGGDGVGKPAPDFTGYTDYTNSPTNPCFCCINYNVFEYEKCSYDPGVDPLPGCANMDQTVYVQVADPANPPANAVISFGANSCCYSLVGDTCQDPTLDYNIEDGVTVNSCNDEPCLTIAEPKRFVYRKCNGSLSTECGEMDQDVVVQLLEADADQYAILSFGNASCCYVKLEETEENPTEGYTKTGTWDGDCVDGFPAECQDDEQFTFQYEHCDGVNSEGCNGTVSPVTIQGTAAQLLNNLILEDSSTGNRCCYVRAEQVTGVPTPNYIIANISLRDCSEEALIEAGCQEGK